MKKINKNQTPLNLPLTTETSKQNPPLSLRSRTSLKKGGLFSCMGFTLIELIVSVTIIAILTVVGMVSFSTTNKKARDSRRIADLENIRMALELYRQGTGSSYPADLDDLVTNSYIQKIPIGPKDEDYSNGYNVSDYTYTLKTTVEDAGSSNVPGFTYQVTNP